MDFLHHVQGIVILNELGSRIFAKYYINADMQARGILTTVDKQRAVELGVHAASRTMKHSCGLFGDGETIIYEGHAVLLQVSEDVIFMVIGDSRENELVLYSVLRGLIEVLRQTLRLKDLNMRALLCKYNAVLLTVDELVDEGIILETNPATINQDVAPFLAESGSETARKALNKVNKYIKENL